MDKCKHCLMTGCLEEFKDYDYQFDEDDPIEVIDVFICSECGCIHHEDGEDSFYEFTVGFEKKTDAIAGWATDHNKKEFV